MCALYVLALCLGLRRGELLGSYGRTSASIRERWKQPRHFNGSAALRFVQLKTRVLRALREHRRQQFTERADAWPNWQENGLVFPARVGSPCSPTTSAEAGVASARRPRSLASRFHDMRHICVSLLLHLGVAPDMVRKIVGHSDIEVTMTIYAHIALDEKRQVLAKWATR